MGTDLNERIAHPVGEQPEVEEWSAVADTFAGRVHIEFNRPLALGRTCLQTRQFALTSAPRVDS